MVLDDGTQHDIAFRLLFEASPHPYLILQPDAAFTIAAVNDRYLSATGTRREAIVGHGLFEIFPDNPDDHSGSGVSDLRSSLNRVLNDRRQDIMGVQKYDIPLRDGSGNFELRYWSPVNTPVFDADGGIACIIHHVEDVTEYILNRERASQENAERLGKVEAHAERMEAEVLRRADEVKKANRALKSAMEKLEQHAAERKRAEALLQESQMRLAAIVDSAMDAIITIDGKERIVLFNPAAELLFQCKADEMLGRPVDHLMPARYAEAHQRHVLDYDQEGVTRRCMGALGVVRGLRANGEEFPLEASISKMQVGQERLFTVIMRDVSERQMAEEALRERDREITLKNLQLEEASQMKSEFLANMSHELRTPLNAIIGFSEVLKDGLMGELSEQQNKYITNIFGSGQHLLSLINDILDLSKVEAGKMSLELEQVEIAPILDNSLSIVKEKAANRRIRLKAEIADNVGAALMDARKVKQIVYNLLSNAVKFTDEGGQVTLCARLVSRAEIGKLSGRNWPGRSFPLADNEFQEFLEIHVSDSGIGIPQDGLKQLFQPFTQIDSGLARKFEGTGLGLVLVKQLAELHGGTVAIESAKDIGSCFTVWLPLRAAEEPSPPAAAGSHKTLPHVAPGERVALVVEDDDQAAELIRLQLEAEGLKVLRTATAEEALWLMQQPIPFRLITLDILLPNMDGWEFLARIRQIPAGAHVPVVIISIVADSNKGISLGASSVLQKPISRPELQEALAGLGMHPPQEDTIITLVVDDDPKAVDLIAAHLPAPAYSVVRAHSGREAIETAQQLLPDLIVLDLMMPEISGFDVVEALKGDPDTASIPILVVTAKQVSAEDRAILNGYVTRIVEKSEFNHGRFIGEVRRALTAHREEG